MTGMAQTAVALDLKGVIMDQKIKQGAMSYRGGGMKSHGVKVTSISGVI